MPSKTTRAKAAWKAPAKGKLAKVGLTLGRKKAARTPAGTAVFYAQALVGNERARTKLRDAVASAKKVYERGTDRRGRLKLAALLDDRKARREGQNALASLRAAVQIADKNRTKPKKVKAPAIAVIVVAGTGAALAANKDLREKALATFKSGDAETNGSDPAAQQAAGPYSAS